jgi:hypothetical protein
METCETIFMEPSSSEHIVHKIKTGEWNDVLQCICSIKNNTILIDYTYFKYFGSNETYDLLINLCCSQIDHYLISNPSLVVHLNLKSLTIVEIDKHKRFIQNIALILSTKYPNKLQKCYIYNAPFVFSQLLNIICMFIDKETQSKFVLVK